MIKRNKTGCISCRIRRVKCDEARPQCLRCQSAKRMCDGYLPEGRVMSRRQMLDALKNNPAIGPASQTLAGNIPMPSSAPIPVFVAMSPSQDTVHFDYFRKATVPNTDSFIPSSFWDQDILQLAYTEPAIWHATLALGALHRRWELQFLGVEMTTLIHRATSHYGKAMALAKDLKSTEKVLALSLSLIASANMLGFWADSHMHLFAGFRILAQNQALSSSSEGKRLSSTLIRLDMQSITFSDTKSPYPFVEASISGGLGQTVYREDTPFSSYSDAASMVFALMRRLLLLDQTFHDGAMSENTFKVARKTLTRDTELFETKMAEFESSGLQFLHADAAISIRIYHAWLRLILKVSLFGAETRFDNCLGHMQHLTTLAYAFIHRKGPTKSLELSLEPAVVAPLFEIGKRCRHPALRRHVLKLMKEMNRHEGMWRSDGAAVTIDSIMEVEEQGFTEEYERFSSGYDNHCASKDVQKEALAIPWATWSLEGYEPATMYGWRNVQQIPERKRVALVMAAPEFKSRILDLKLFMSSMDTTQPNGEIKEIRVSY
ncbi:unnamed protein product [Clonostachys byssicola]|uniref:Zn(2)-C6 fungal-type domain-containing protein n=1 Tax=Clonostachys byssicola TaxID=160290 RepID=A0A9N9Y7E3_9HYPO|nr:unnamed protein product [Clonostachys byssicola]